MDVKLETIEVTRGSAIAALQANKIQIIFLLDATPKRALAVDFPSQPLLNYAWTVTGCEDLKMVPYGLPAGVRDQALTASLAASHLDY